MKPPILLSASLAVGFCAGLATHWGKPVSAASESSLGTEGTGTGAGQIQNRLGHPNEEPPASFLGVSDGAGFSALSPEKQKDAIARLSARLMKQGKCSDQILLARVAEGLSFEQAAAFRESLPKPESGKPDPNDKARGVLAERLAALDPARALEMGKTAEDPRFAQAAIMALAQKNGADALRALAELPDQFGARVAAEMRTGFNDGVGKASGTVAGMADVLRANPKLLDPKSSSEGAVRRFVGQVASQAASIDPVGAMADVRAMAASLVQPKPGEEPKAAESALVARIASQMTRAMRIDSPESERFVFNALADSEKNDVMVSMEAAARFRAGGVEDALQFAEKQGKEQFTKSAAGGVWWSLAQQDRASAMQWIETLPQGSFRDGALNSIIQESAFRTRTWDNPDESLKAAEDLLSRRSKLDYYALMAGQRRGGLSSSEFIAGLPLPEVDKNELRRRMAPIRAK